MNEWQRVRSPAVILLFVTGSLIASTGGARAQAKQGVCAVAAGTVGTQKYVTLKCHRADDPGNFVIRSTRWERDGKKEYRELARLSGRRFKCTLTKGGRSTSGDTLLTHYNITNCR
jgi:hypothetical protein